MNMRRFTICILVGLPLIVAGQPLMAKEPAQAEAQAVRVEPVHAVPVRVPASAQTFIEDMAQEASRALTSPGISRAQRITLFHKLLKENFDVGVIGKWVLGRYWRRATAREKKEYLKLFEDYITITYVERFDQYSGEKLNVIKSIANPGEDALVFSEIRRPSGGDPISVNWRVRGDSEGYKVIDIYVEGISMSQTQRKEFTSVIRANGGTVAGLLDVLRKQVAKMGG